MKSLRKVLAAIRKGDHLFNLIEKGDRIMVGVSGGKDSLTLLYTLKLYQNFPHTDFEIIPVLLDLGFPNSDFHEIINYCHSLGLQLLIYDSRSVYNILSIQKELKHMDHLPCSICSRMKKAAINKVANELGCNKVAFAHHADDGVETLLMNAIYGGRLATFAPKMYLENAKITFIRPLILAREKDIASVAKELNFPILKSSCPNDKHTMREKTKRYLNFIYKEHPEAYENFVSLLYDDLHQDLWNTKIYESIEGSDLSIKKVTSKEDTLLMMNIRRLVFVEEQNIPYDIEFDNLDSTCDNFLLYKKNEPIGTIRYRNIDNYIKIERFSILKEYRNKGYGKEYLKSIEQKIKSKYGNANLLIHAQKNSLNFYLSLGYHPTSEEFLEGGILHIEMKKHI